MDDSYQINTFGSPMVEYGTGVSEPTGSINSTIGGATSSSNIVYTAPLPFTSNVDLITGRVNSSSVVTTTVPIYTASVDVEVCGAEVDSNSYGYIYTANLSDFTVLDTIKTDIEFSIYALESFLTSLNPIANAIDIERGNYIESNNDHGQFDALLIAFQKNIKLLLIELGESMTIAPEYVNVLRSTLKEMNLNFISPQMQILRMSIDTTEGAASVAVPKKLIAALIPNMLSGMFTKIALNFRTSEFSLAFNWSILDAAITYNTGLPPNKSLDFVVAYITSNIDFLRSKSSFYNTFCDNMTNRLQAKLTGANRFTSSGEINTSEWILRDLSPTAIEKVMKVKRLSNLVMNHTINELRINMGLDTIRFSQFIFPTTVSHIQ